MKKFRYSVIILFLLLFVQQVFAGNSRPTSVRVVGLLPDTPVMGTNISFRCWLNDDENGAFTDETALQLKFEPEKSSDAEAGQYRLTFNISKFPSWNAGDKVHIEVTYNGRKSEPWVRTIESGSQFLNFYKNEADFIVFPELKLNVTASAATFCAGTAATLTPKMSDGSSVAGTTWKNADGSAIAGLTVNATTGVANFSGVAAGTYSVVAEKSGVVSDPVAITINPMPEATTLTAAPTTVCDGDVVTLTATCTTPGVTYEWSVSGSGSVITHTPDGNFNYTVKAKLGDCSTSATARVQKKQTMALSGNVSTTCETGTFQAKFSVTNAGSGNYQVAKDADFTDVVTSGITWSGNTATITKLPFGSHTYYVKREGTCGVAQIVAANDGSGCGCEASFEVKMLSGTESKPGEALKPITIVANYDAPFTSHSCKLKGPDGSTVMEWTNEKNKTMTYNPTKEGTYTLADFEAHTESGYSCGKLIGPGTASPSIGASDLTVTVTGSSGCANASLTAEAVVSGGKEPFTYKWSSDVQTLSGTSAKATVTNAAQVAAGTYTVRVEVTDAAKQAKTAEGQVTIFAQVAATGDALCLNAETFDGLITVTKGEAPYKLYTDQAATSEVANAQWTGSQGKVPGLPSDKPYTYYVQDKNKCNTVKVNIEADCACGAQLKVDLSEAACAQPDAERTITLTASGGTSYSFQLVHESGNILLKVDGETSDTWEVKVPYADRGKYRVENFKAKTVAVPDGCEGNVAPREVDVQFLPTPQVTAGDDIIACGTDPITLKANGDSGLTFEWDNGVVDGEEFVPAMGETVYTVRGTNAAGCWNEASVTVTVSEKPMVSAMATPTAVCKGDALTLTSSGTADTYVWDNGGVEGDGNMPEATTRYTVTGTMDATGCSDTASVLVVVNMPAEIVEAPKDRTIAIGRGASFTVKAIGNGLTYQWQWYNPDTDVWTTFTDNTTSFPKVSGATTETIELEEVPQSWDGRKIKCIVQGECGDPAEAEASFGVKECFDIMGDIAMGEGIIPETGDNKEVDGWYCKGTRISVKALIELVDPEYGEAAFSHYTWTIDGLPADKVIESDSSILSWIPEYYEDDIVVKVGVYCDGACEQVYSRPLRLKARTPDDVKMKILTSVDPDHRFCPGDTVSFTVALENDQPGSEVHWYKDIFDRGRGFAQQFVMDQKDTWVRTVFEPSPEMCVEHEVSDSVFLRVKESVQPTLSIDNNIHDTIACQGDSLVFRAQWTNAGAHPTLIWHQDIWERGFGEYADIQLSDKDTWVKCELRTGDDVCYTGARIIDTMVVRVIEPGTLTIECDMTDKHFGDELVFTTTVGGNVGEHWKYNWFLNNGMLLEYTDPEFSSNELKQGDVVQASIVGNEICVNRIWSNEIVVNYKNYMTRDTMVTIYVGEKITNLNMFKEGDTGRYFIISEYPRNGQASMNPQTGEFSYTPNRDFVGVDLVTYRVQHPGDKTNFEEGTIFITVESGGLYDIPNIITPNGDGKNDVWNLSKITEQYSEYVITLYSRSGRVVWQVKNDYDNQFDGQGSGNGTYFVPSLPSGIYTYVIDLNRGERKLVSWLEIRTTFNRGYYR